MRRTVVRWLVTAAPVLAAAAPGAGPAARRPTARAAAVARPRHVKTVEAAIGTLPEQLKPFYKAHRAEMPSPAIEPEFPPRSPSGGSWSIGCCPFPFRELPAHRGRRSTAKYGEKADGRRAPALAGPGVLRPAASRR